ncbi:hypothetical protein E2562_029543 [Oryza meyeriana var. granulata]|uniref:Eukaryotic translation initiation factor 3 30 kDa subunit n=1 Tax=Oryza meyeriana var. granulata TaxID=110450 RepID=A0A6G1FDT2_9ORYZ|nr:hypothetical protein E2562_029543 [Oryza meyeriana var. granulata]
MEDWGEHLSISLPICASRFARSLRGCVAAAELAIRCVRLVLQGRGADAKDISSSIAAIANEKIKAEKEAAAGKKKQGAKKKQLHMENKDDDFIPGRGNFDDQDEYDFM